MCLDAIGRLVCRLWVALGSRIDAACASILRRGMQRPSDAAVVPAHGQVGTTCCLAWWLFFCGFSSFSCESALAARHVSIRCRVVYPNERIQELEDTSLSRGREDPPLLYQRSQLEPFPFTILLHTFSATEFASGFILGTALLTRIPMSEAGGTCSSSVTRNARRTVCLWTRGHVAIYIIRST